MFSFSQNDLILFWKAVRAFLGPFELGKGVF